MSHHGPPGPENCLHDDQLAEIDNLDWMDGGDVSTDQQLDVTALSVELPVLEGVAIAVPEQVAFDIGHLGPGELARDLVQADRLNLVNVAVNITQRDLEQFSDLLGLGSVSADEDKRNISSFQLVFTSYRV